MELDEKGWKLEEEGLETDKLAETRRKADQIQTGQELSRVEVELDGSHDCEEWILLWEALGGWKCGRKEEDKRTRSTKGTGTKVRPSGAAV